MADDGAQDGFESLLMLGSTLQHLPDEKFLAVIDKLAIVSQMAPVAAIFDEARPRMRVLKPQRPRSLQRPLCRPFEDLFAVRSPIAASDSLLDRSVIGPLWRHVEASEPAAVRTLQAIYKQTPATDPQKNFEIGGQVWRVTATALAKAPIPEVDPEVSALIRDIMLAAVAVETFKRKFPLRPLARFGDSEKALVKEQLDALSTVATAGRGYLVAIAARMASPTELLCWLREAGRTVPPILERFALSKVTDSINQFDQHIVQVDPENLAGRAQELLAILETADAATSGAARATVKGQADAVKIKVRDALKSHVIDVAAAGIASAMTGEASRDSLLAAEGYARALAKTRKSAGKVGLGTATDSAIQSVRRNCMGRIDDLLKPAPSSGDPAADYAKTRTQVFQSVRIIELVDGASAGRDVLADAQRRLKALPR